MFSLILFLIFNQEIQKEKFDLIDTNPISFSKLIKEVKVNKEENTKSLPARQIRCISGFR